jgi:glycosyltransferase 2 family protein
LSKKLLFRIVTVGALAALLYFALHNAPLPDILAVLGRLQIWQVFTLLILDALIYLLVTARWWYIIHAENQAVPFLPLIAVRLSAFGISYFTVGPQVGGEALQILHLQRKYGLTYTHATSTVVLDKLLEFLVNFIVLAFGLAAVLGTRILPGRGSLSMLSVIGLAVLGTWPLIHILLLHNHILPLSALIRILAGSRRGSNIIRFVGACEHLAGRFCQRHAYTLWAAILASLLAGTATISEYALIISFLQIGLNFWQTVAAWTVGWLSFLVPLPGGLGAFEASQVFALGAFGYAAPVAVSVVLWIRGRDLLIGGLGLFLAGRTLAR